MGSIVLGSQVQTAGMRMRGFGAGLLLVGLVSSHPFSVSESALDGYGAPRGEVCKTVYVKQCSGKGNGGGNGNAQGNGNNGANGLNGSNGNGGHNGDNGNNGYNGLNGNSAINGNGQNNGNGADGNANANGEVCSTVTDNICHLENSQEC